MSKPKKKPDLKALLKNSSLPMRAVSYVTDRKLAAEFQRLQDELQAAGEKRASDTRMSSEIKRIAGQIQDLRDQMEATTIVFSLRGMRAADWRALKAKHPLESDEPNALDRFLEADSNALFAEAVRLSMVDEDMDENDWHPLADDYEPLLDDEDWENFIGKCTDGDWERFTDAVFAMNEQGSAIPFSRAASSLLQMSDDD